MKTSLEPEFTAPAYVWDGIYQLPGVLEIWSTEVIFHFKNFKESHLNLMIPIENIESADELLIFEIARNGLAINSKKGRRDLFVLDESQACIKTLRNIIGNR